MGLTERIGQLVTAIGILVIVVATLLNQGEIAYGFGIGPDFMSNLTEQTINYTRIGAVIAVIGMLIWAKIWTRFRKEGN